LLLLAFFVQLTVLFSRSSERRPSSISWSAYPGPSDKGGGKVLIFFNDPGCGWCKRMVEDTLPARRVELALVGFTCYVVQGERSVVLPNGRSFRANHWPALLAFGSDGAFLGAIRGWKPVALVEHKLKRIQQGIDTVPELHATLGRDPTNSVARWKLLSALGPFEKEYQTQVSLARSLDPRGESVCSKLLDLYDSYPSEWPSRYLFENEEDPFVRFIGWWNLAWSEHYVSQEHDRAWSAYAEAARVCPSSHGDMLVAALRELALDAPRTREKIGLCVRKLITEGRASEK
jgi:hypothetical protein